MVTDDLLAGISEELTKDLELFLINSIDGAIMQKNIKEKIVEFINSAYREGLNKALEMIKEEEIEKRKIAIDELRKDNEKFLKDFNNKLLDGQDNPIS